MTPQEAKLFNELNNYVSIRENMIKEHFGQNFLELYLIASEREWYNRCVSKIDKEIVNYANQISKLLNFNKTYKKVADVFKDETISDWYNKINMEYYKEHGEGFHIDYYEKGVRR